MVDGSAEKIREADAAVERNGIPRSHVIMIQRPVSISAERAIFQKGCIQATPEHAGGPTDCAKEVMRAVDPATGLPQERLRRWDVLYVHKMRQEQADHVKDPSIPDEEDGEFSVIA